MKEILSGMQQKPNFAADSPQRNMEQDKQYHNAEWIEVSILTCHMFYCYLIGG